MWCQRKLYFTSPKSSNETVYLTPDSCDGCVVSLVLKKNIIKHSSAGAILPLMKKIAVISIGPGPEAFLRIPFLLTFLSYMGRAVAEPRGNKKEEKITPEATPPSFYPLAPFHMGMRYTYSRTVRTYVVQLSALWLH